MKDIEKLKENINNGDNHKIYIMLTRTGTVLSKLIHLYTKAPYSHVSLSFDIDLEEVYSFGRYNPYNPIYAGFVKEKVKYGGTYARFPETICAIYSLEVSYEQYKKMEEQINNFKKEEDKYKYNLLGLIGVMFNVPINRDYNYFCSQFVSKILNDSGVDLLSKDIGLVKPEDFRQCGKLELVYEGKLRDIFKMGYSYSL